MGSIRDNNGSLTQEVGFFPKYPSKSYIVVGFQLGRFHVTSLDLFLRIDPKSG